MKLNQTEANYIPNGDKCPRYTDRVKAFFEDYPDYPSKKDCFSSLKAKVMSGLENLESCSFQANPTAYNLIYLAAFLVYSSMGMFALSFAPTYNL